MSNDLAINGGPKAVTNTLQGWPQFEKKFTECQGSAYAVSTSSGTLALHVGLSAPGIGPGDEVIVPSSPVGIRRSTAPGSRCRQKAVAVL